jgi:hypothetical protein
MWILPWCAHVARFVMGRNGCRVGDLLAVDLLLVVATPALHPTPGSAICRVMVRTTSVSRFWYRWYTPAA